MPSELLIGKAALVLLYAGFVLALLLLGRRDDARAWGGFVPDCLVLFKRLIADDRVSRGRKALLVVVVAYLALPFDLVPDFIPVAGQLDDAIIVALALRILLRGSGHALATEHWPGPQRSLGVILRLAGAAPAEAGADAEAHA
jgi:uncharacterized membrane protein YkvA (DUF1232 family)